ncbi:conjugal transfer protein TrbL family protein [Catenulispora pinisilvae]|uniref:conjugal transfer protein TrbL family protein n=1 Tax=Catenulispora pinisilvae TaxID=2705253 RepID=UPI0018924051|nr:conjugal transfer protein TrbL family protein [Catenulispora pinisilvae]
MPSPLPGIYGPGFGPGSSVPAPGGPIPGQDEPDKQDPGLFDIPGQIEKAIDTWFGHLVKQALEPVLKLLGTTLLASPNLTDGRISQIWDGVLITANTVYVLFILVGGLTVMGHETVQSRYAVKEIIPRLVIGMIASNASLWLINQLIGIGNALSAALLTGPVSAQGVGNALTSTLTDQVLLPGAGNLFLMLIGLAIAVLGVALLITYLTRSAVLIVLTAGSPLAFACHALPWTEGVAKLWWRAIFGCIAIQVLQALVLITSIQIFFDPQTTNVFGLPTGGGLLDLLICLCLFIVLLKIPGWVQRVVLGRSPFHTSPVGRMARAFLYYKTWGLMRHGFRPPGRGGTGSSRSAPPPTGGAVGPFIGPRPGGGGSGSGGWRPKPPTMTVTQEPPPDMPPSGAPPNPRPPAPAPLPPPGPMRRPLALPPGRSTRLDQRHRATVANPPARGEQAPLFSVPEPPRRVPKPPTTQGVRERGRQHR